MQTVVMALTGQAQKRMGLPVKRVQVKRLFALVVVDLLCMVLVVAPTEAA